MRADSELAVLTKAKNLISYVFVVSETAPKKYRFSLLAKMQNLSLDILESLILANEVLLGHSAVENEKRLQLQHDALAKLKVLDAVCLIARVRVCVTPRQYTVLSELIADCCNMTGAWIHSDRKRSGGG